MNEISDRIKLLCNDTSARAFAIKIGVSPTTFNEYFKNNRTPSIDVVIKICETTNISYKWLLTGNGEMYENSLPSKNDISDIIDTMQQLKIKLEKYL